LLGILKKSREGKLLPGNSFDQLHRITEGLANQEARDQLRSLKDTFIENVWYVYFSFAFLYFLLIPRPWHWGPDVLVVCGLLLVLCCYVLLYWIVGFMLEHYGPLSKELSFMKSDAVADHIFARYGIKLESPPNGSGLSRHKRFTSGSNEFIWIHLRHGELFRADRLQRLIDKRFESNRTFVVAVCARYMADVSGIEAQYPDHLKILSYADEQELEQELESFIHELRSR
jgi:hypothetical protein